MTVDYYALRNGLASALRDVPGVMSVGIGKENSQIVLVVAIDPNLFEGGVPSSFEGVDVVIRNLGVAKLHCYGRSEDAGRHSTIE